MSKIAIVGATGAVGQVMTNILNDISFPITKIKFLASARSTGKKIKFRNKEYQVEELTKDSFKGLDYALFSAGSAVSKIYAKYAVEANCIVIDNSSCFRMDKDTPLVIPEVNAIDALTNNGIIANPNCTTIIMLLAVKPLADLYKLKNIVVSTYQSASGAGALGMEELTNQLTNYTKDKTIFESKIFAKQLVNNLIPQIGNFSSDSYTEEELKMVNESKKILSLPDITVTATCVRVPVLTAHSESVYLEFNEETKVDIKKVEEVLNSAKGLDLLNNENPAIFPTPLAASNINNCQVGRIRKANGKDNALTFWICGDQLRKGAALNAIQIMEYLYEQNR